MRRFSLWCRLLRGARCWICVYSHCRGFVFLLRLIRTLPRSLFLVLRIVVCRDFAGGCICRRVPWLRKRLGSLRLRQRSCLAAMITRVFEYVITCARRYRLRWRRNLSRRFYLVLCDLELGSFALMIFLAQGTAVLVRSRRRIEDVGEGLCALVVELTPVQPGTHSSGFQRVALPRRPRRLAAQLARRLKHLRHAPTHMSAGASTGAAGRLASGSR